MVLAIDTCFVRLLEKIIFISWQRGWQRKAEIGSCFRELNLNIDAMMTTRQDDGRGEPRVRLAGGLTGAERVDQMFMLITLRS